MATQSILMYILLVIIATSSPGPAVVFIVTNSLLHGWKKASFAALGNICGLIFLGIISVTGLGSLLNTSQILFNAVRFLGAGYLMYIGFKMLLNKNTEKGWLPDRQEVQTVKSRELFFKAFTVAVSNPKAILFLTALFPQFITSGQDLAVQFSLLVSILMFFSFSFLMFYALLAAQVKDWLNTPARIGLVNRAGGSVFITLGLLMAASGRK